MEIMITPPLRECFWMQSPAGGERDRVRGLCLFAPADRASSTLTTNSPESGLNFQVTEIWPGNRRLGLSARQSVRALDPLRQGGGEKAVDVAIEHRAGIAGFDPRPQILHHLIGLQHVGTDLVAPADIGLGCIHRL